MMEQSEWIEVIRAARTLCDYCMAHGGSGDCKQCAVSEIANAAHNEFKEGDR